MILCETLHPRHLYYERYAYRLGRFGIEWICWTGSLRLEPQVRKSGNGKRTCSSVDLVAGFHSWSVTSAKKYFTGQTVLDLRIIGGCTLVISLRKCKARDGESLIKL
jgi:hypothetical protein